MLDPKVNLIMEQIKKAEEGGALIKMLPIVEEYLDGDPRYLLENIYDHIWFKEETPYDKTPN